MTSPQANVHQTSGPDFLSNQGADEPVITIARQKKVMGHRNFQGEPTPELPPIAETVLLSILGGEEMDWCVERLGNPDDTQILEGRGKIVTLPAGDGQISIVGPCVYAPLVGGTFENLAHHGDRKSTRLNSSH